MASNEGISPSIIAAGKYTPGVTSQQGLSAICEVLTDCHVALTCLLAPRAVHLVSSGNELKKVGRSDTSYAKHVVSWKGHDHDGQQRAVFCPAHPCVSGSVGADRSPSLLKNSDWWVQIDETTAEGFW